MWATTDWSKLASQSPPSLRTRGFQSPRLRRLAQTAAAGARPQQQPQEEHCELCGELLPGEHRHLIDIQDRRLLCSCRACSLLFDSRGAGGGHYRLVGDRRVRLADLKLSDQAWDALRIPVEMAFFFRNSAAERVVAFYPSPLGATESRLELSAWEELERENPLLKTLEPDVEALLVNRARGRRGAWLVPIDDCYRLVAVIRTRWRGFSGGKEVWLEIERFFEQLDQQATTRASAPHIST